ncbi:ring-hydroxylating dioxygenase, large terminal subunit [Hoeflea sp. IMCC20628]|uniref:aromatic ring-hydroxylating oxygenase subunit alpha n=1 Tax=Hoeflea sp. IMCC20628 TaxID=1620421 RepID=UPI00063AC746|nr:aromatic ring-hydroxylating dioxygenase subunit alpha [Hoeflea sp. IMCC20628]AKH99847.1 ring-hydroxylating dioxygenase, large terminal subunit [Hoeflea sp. IMCC20628]
MNSPMSHRDITIPETWDRSGLPGWTYHSQAFLELEKQEIFRKHWQIACHVSDLPEPGNYIAFDMCGERALVLRGADGEVRAFHNMCRHRGARVVANEQGSCKGALVCPFHGWVYNLDGTLRGAARPKSFPDLDKTEFGLQPLEAEVWNGFVFIRFEKGPQPAVAELFKPFADEIAHFDIADMVPCGETWTMVSKVNWKSVRDVDNEGYHVALAHPALQDLYGRSYFDEPFVNGLSRSYAECNENGRRWSVRNYLKAMQPRPGMPDHLKRAWVYYGMFPNAVIAATPELVQFYQEFPLSTGETLLRGSIYRYRDETRQQTLARKLAARIDFETMGEDVRLTEWSNEAMNSTAFKGFYLSDLEYGVRSHHDHLRAVLPISSLEQRPHEDDMARLNSEMTISF